jgi:hypothetical protein
MSFLNLNSPQQSLALMQFFDKGINGIKNVGQLIALPLKLFLLVFSKHHCICDQLQILELLNN